MRRIYFFINIILLVEISSAQVVSVNDYFPANNGDKWIYKSKGYDPSEPPFFYYDTIFVEVVGDTILSNSYQYKIFREGLNDSYFRIDSIENKVYEFNHSDSSNNYESVYLDFNVTLNNAVIYPDSIGRSFLQSDSILFDNVYYQTFVYEYIAGSIGLERKYLKGLGRFTLKMGSISFVEQELIGCIINNKIYGDTLLTHLDKFNTIKYDFRLFNNYPNPFNPSTTIQFKISNRFRVILKILNILGEEVATLVNSVKNPGVYEVIFSAGNLTSGVYICQLTCNNFIQSKKIVLIK